MVALVYLHQPKLLVRVGMDRGSIDSLRLLRTLNALMVSQFGDLDDYTIFNPSTERFTTIPNYISDQFGWSYSSLQYAYGILWAFIVLQLLLTVFGLARINFTRR